MENSQHTSPGQVADSESRHAFPEVSEAVAERMAEWWRRAWEGSEPGSGPVDVPTDPSG